MREREREIFLHFHIVFTKGSWCHGSMTNETSIVGYNSKVTRTFTRRALEDGQSGIVFLSAVDILVLHILVCHEYLICQAAGLFCESEG